MLRSKETLRAARPLPRLLGYQGPMTRWTDEVYHESLAMTQIFAVAAFEAILGDRVLAKTDKDVRGWRQRLTRLGREGLVGRLDGVFQLRNVILHRGGVVDGRLAELRHWQAGRPMTEILTVEVVSADIGALEAAAVQVAANAVGTQQLGPRL